MAKQVIDVEEALAWAFGVVRIDDRIGALSRYGIDGRSAEAMRVLGEIGMPRSPGCRSASDLLAGYAVLGISLGRTAAGVAGRPASAAEMEERDAVAIHDAVLDLGAIWIEELEDGVVLWDEASVVAAGHRVHRRASEVWLEKSEGAWVRLSDPGIMALVIGHARTATRPDWGEAYGKVLKGRDGAGRFSGRTDEDLWEAIVWQRSVYTVWHRALADVATRLAGRLEGWEIGGPRAEAAPWSCAAEKRVFPGSPVERSNALKTRRKKSA